MIRGSHHDRADTIRDQFTFELFTPAHEEVHRKEIERANAQVPLRNPLDASQVGTTDGESRRRRHQHQTRDQQCAPRLLLGQEQQRKKKGRPRLTRRERVEREIEQPPAFLVGICAAMRGACTRRCMTRRRSIATSRTAAAPNTRR